MLEGSRLKGLRDEKGIHQIVVRDDVEGKGIF